MPPALPSRDLLTPYPEGLDGFLLALKSQRVLALPTRRQGVCEGTRAGMHKKGRGLRRFRKQSDRRLEEVAKAVGGGYCQLQVPLNLARAVREAVAGHRLGALEGPWGPGGGGGSNRKATK